MNNENSHEFEWTPFERELAGRFRQTRGRPTRACISPEDLIGLVEQGARYPNAATLRAHLVGCDYCLEEFNAVRVLVSEPDTPEVASRMYATPLESDPMPSRVAASAAVQPVRTLFDTSGPISVTEAGEVSLRGRQTLPDSIAAWARELVSAHIVQPIATLQETLEHMRRMSSLTPARALRGSSPIPLSPHSTAIRSGQPLLRWKGLPNADEYTVLLGRQRNADVPRPEIIHKWSAGRAGESVVPSEVTLEPGTVYVWQVAATVSGESHPSAYARFFILSEDEARQLDAAERQLPESSLLRVGLYEAYGLYEEALAQADILAKLNIESPVVEAILDSLHRRLEGEGDTE